MLSDRKSLEEKSICVLGVVVNVRRDEDAWRLLSVLCICCDRVVPLDGGMAIFMTLTALREAQHMLGQLSRLYDTCRLELNVICEPELHRLHDLNEYAPLCLALRSGWL